MQLRLPALPRHPAATLLALLPLVAVPAAQAGDTAPAPKRTSVGVAVVALKSPYAGYDTDTIPAPLISYEGRSFYFRGGAVGYRLVNQGGTELSATLSPYMMRFKHRDTDNPQLRLLSNRSLSGMAGLAWRHSADWGVVQASAEAEVTGHGGGVAADARYSYPLPVGKVRLIPGVGVNYASSKLNDYYFGVSQAEALRSGLARYEAGSGASPYMDVTVVMPLGTHWTGTASLRRSRLSDAVRDSPMTRGDHMDSAAVSLSYGF